MRLLATCRGLFAKELTPEEAAYWREFLNSYSLEELRYAFDNWQRNGQFFPKPSDIVQLVDVFRKSITRRIGHPGCDELCKSRHGRGYGEGDVLWLWHRMEQHVAAGRSVNASALLDELDSKREDGPPAWRKRAE
jgi:hypothetical protein